jgi:hypothetical protein
MKDPISLFEKYDPAMRITESAQAEAYFQECVAHSMSHGLSRERAEELERANLGYFAGYYSRQTRVRVEKLFGCVHPILPPASEGQMIPEEILKIGLKAGRDLKKIYGQRTRAKARDQEQ